MTPERWLADSVADARERGLEGAVPVLEAIARAMRELRGADWNDDCAAPTVTQPSANDGETR